jgi:guanyl-specific ribonuclease Sa
MGTELIAALLVVIFLAGNVLPAFADTNDTNKSRGTAYSDAQTYSDLVTSSDLVAYSDLVTYSDFVAYVESYVYTDFYEYVDDVQVVVLQPGDYRNSSLLFNDGRGLDIGKVAESAVMGLGDIVVVGLTMGPHTAIVVAGAALITAAIAGTVTYVNSGGDTAKAIENASTGFMWAAMVTSVAVPLAGAKLAGRAGVKGIQTVSKQGAQTAVKVADKADDVKKVKAAADKADDAAKVKPKRAGIKGVIPDKVKELVEKLKRSEDLPPNHYNSKGAAFHNRENRLPNVDSNGNRITYREYDANPSLPDTGRGPGKVFPGPDGKPYRRVDSPERIVKGSDGKIYYTDDHYITFKEVG